MMRVIQRFQVVEGSTAYGVDKSRTARVVILRSPSHEPFYLLEAEGGKHRETLDSLMGTRRALYNAHFIIPQFRQLDV